MVSRSLRLSLVLVLNDKPLITAPKLIEATSKQEQVDNEALFADQLKKYDPIVGHITQSVDSQNKFLEDIKVRRGNQNSETSTKFS